MITRLIRVILTGIVLLSCNQIEAREHHRHRGVIELKAGGKSMSIQAPTYVQDDTLKPADVSIADVFIQPGTVNVNPGTTNDLFSTTFSVPTGQQWRISVKAIADLNFVDNAILSPLFAGAIDIIRDGALKAQGVRLYQTTKVAAGNILQDMTSQSVAWSELLSEGTYTIVMRIECSALSSVFAQVSNGYFEVLKFKA